jgi:RHS repeat-associated protein
VAQLIQDGGNYYIYGPDGLPVERVGADPTRWLGIDATGSVVVTTDDSAAVTSSVSYDAWGNPTVASGAAVSLGWHGQYHDTETGLYYLRHRYYDPAAAQFTSPDPLYAVTGSRYGYAGNDPVNGRDPNGLFGIPFTDYCVDIGDSHCNSRADEKSLKDAPEGIVRNRGTLATLTATGICMVPGVGWASCAGWQSFAYGVRAEQRINEHGFKKSLTENGFDLGITITTFGTGHLPEWMSAFRNMTLAQRYFVERMIDAPDATRSILESCRAG